LIVLGYLVAWGLVVVWLLVSGMVNGLAPHMSQELRIISGHAGASVVLLAVLAVLGRFWKSSGLALPTWGRVSAQDWARGLLATLGLYLLHHLFVMARHQPQEPWMAQVAGLGTMDYLIMAVGVATVVPVSEEVMFRQILSRLPSDPAPRINARLVVCMLLSCAAFAGMHYSQYQFVSTMALVGAVGVVCMWARWRTGGLALPVVLHGFASLLALAFNALY
jgi:uncharacterized protein